MKKPTILSLAFSFLCLPVLLSFFSCNNNKSDSFITIAGQVDSFAVNKLYLFSYKNEIDKYNNQKSIIDSSEIASDGNYIISLAANTPNFYDLKCGDNILRTNLFLQPGDNLIINFNGAENKTEINDATVAGYCNKFLLQFIEHFFQSDEVKHFYYVESNYLNLADYEKYTSKRMTDETDFFNSYFKNPKPDKVFSDFMLSEIQYEYYNDNLMLRWKRRMRNQRMTDSTDAYLFLKNVAIEDSLALNSPAYFRFIKLYINDLYAQRVEKGLDPTTINSTAAIEKQKIADEKFHGIFKTIALSVIDESIAKIE